MLFISMMIDEEQSNGDKRSVRVGLEHSLVSVSKWEAKWHVPFFADDDKTEEQVLDYIRCMIVRDDQEPYIAYLTEDHVNAVNSYLDDPATATKLYSLAKGPSSLQRKITSEVLYYQMIVRNIPMECQYWNINRLLTLIHVWDVYNSQGKSNTMSRKQTAAFYAKENTRRRKLSNSKG